MLSRVPRALNCFGPRRSPCDGIKRDLEHSGASVFSADAIPSNAGSRGGTIGSTPSSTYTSRVSPRTYAQVFRIVATAEAVSWAGLLIGMYFKYLTDAGDFGVRIFGPIHGGSFVAYVVMTFLVSRAFAWGRWTTLAGLACSVPPFATVAFEMWARRHGWLSTRALLLLTIRSVAEPVLAAASKPRPRGVGG